MASYDEAAVRQRLMDDLRQVQSDIYARTKGDQAMSPSEAIDGTGVSSEQMDEGTALDEYERSQGMIDNDRSMERQIQAALERLDMGKYGVCERCGKPIDPRRLAALPYATFDIECEKIVEAERAARR